MPSSPPQPSGTAPEPDAIVAGLLSADRFAPYLGACSGSHPDALQLYCWNSHIAAAFFEELGHLEVMLRNALDARLVHRQQRRDIRTEWFDDPHLPLTDRARADIREARRRAGITGASTPRGKIIAELSFGFWRFLLARQYRATLWPDLSRAFPHAPSRALTLVEDPIKRLHKLRNRIAHHEGIWHLPLDDRRHDLHTVLGYLDPTAQAWVTGHGRVSTVLAQRP